MKAEDVARVRRYQRAQDAYILISELCDEHEVFSDAEVRLREWLTAEIGEIGWLESRANAAGRGEDE